MVGANVTFKPGSVYRDSLRAIGVQGLHEAIKERQAFHPSESVMMVKHLFVDSVTLEGRTFKYAVLRADNNIFLMEVKEGTFTDAEIARFAGMAAGLS